MSTRVTIFVTRMIDESARFCHTYIRPIYMYIIQEYTSKRKKVLCRRRHHLLLTTMWSINALRGVVTFSAKMPVGSIGVSRF